jgi:hypothetical protein
METTNLFDDGLKSDYSPSNQPEKSYVYCLNGMNISQSGDIFTLSNEKGTVDKVSNFPEGFKIIGGTVLNTDLIIILVNPDGPYSQIGIVDSSFSYTRIVPNSNTNNELGLSISYQVDCVARKLFTGDRLLYFTDNNRDIGYLNLDNPPTSLAGNTSLFPDVSSASVNFVNISEEGGNLHCGVYQFAVRYKTEELNSTPIGLISNVVPIVDENRSVGRDLYDGAYPTIPLIVNKSINLSIADIDTDFPFLELIAIKYDGLSNELKVEALPLIRINGRSTISIVYDGNDADSTYLTRDEVTQIPVIYNTAKCIEQKDGRLIISNLGYDSEEFDFQEIANDIVIKYTIEELQYADGYTGTSALTFGIVNTPYIIEDSQWDIYIKFTEQVDETTGLTLTNYNINYAPDNPTTHVIGPDYVLEDRVETSNYIYTCILAAGSGANAPTGAATSNAWWQFTSYYIVNPTSAVVDSVDSSIVILTMDDTDSNEMIYEGIEVEVLNVENYDLTETIVTTTEVISTSGTDTTVTSTFFNDYKNEKNTYDKKGYQREEIYSFGMGVIWKNGSRSFIYHIPGFDHTTPITTNANTGTKVLGTYVSDADYPLDQNYLAGKVRHHKMPSLSDEPHYRIDSTTGVTYIRILGIDITNVNIPSEIQDKIDRIIFVRQSRNTSTNRSILAQGLVNNLMRVGTEFNENSGSVDTSSRVYKKVPFFNNFAINQTDASIGISTPDSAVFDYNTPESDVAAFFSPDTILGEKDISEYSKIKNVLVIKGNVTRERFQASENKNINRVVNRTYSLFHPYIAWLFANYTDYESPTQTDLDIEEKQFILAGDKRTHSDILPDHDIDNSISGKFLCIKTSSAIPNANSSTYTVHLSMNSDIPTIAGERTPTNYDNLIGSDNVKNNLFNIYKENSTQYGQVEQSEYQLIFDSTNPSLVDYNSIFNGDTFISRFAFGNKDNYDYRALFHLEITPLTGFGIPRSQYKKDPTNYVESISGYPYKGLDLRAISYFFVESTINCNYRHQYTDGISSGVTYFPKSNAFDTLSADPRNGDATSYNTQYSFENSLQSFFTKNATFANVTRFETRSIYSEEMREDDVVDNYRVFLPNNYYDLPKHTGEIWDSFVSNNILYLHTPKSLWRTYFNDVVQQANDIGQTILGTGGVFTLPSIQVITSQGGYAGTISQYGGVHTPYGYIFPDALQGKIFLLGEGLNDISMGISRYLSNNLTQSLVSGSNYIDNPANPESIGIIGAYDFDYKRYIITKVNGEGSFTISCSLLNPSKPTWVSYHSYFPNNYFSINNRLFGFDNNNTVLMHEHNVGDYGVYYESSPNPFTLKYVINENPIVEKTFDNLYIYSEAYDNSNFLPLETFKSLQCFNNKQDTGLITLSCTNSFNDNSNVKKKRDRFQIAIPRNSLGSSPMFRDRMKGEWVYVQLSYPNTNNYKLLVNFINGSLRQVSR